MSKHFVTTSKIVVLFKDVKLKIKSHETYYDMLHRIVVRNDKFERTSKERTLWKKECYILGALCEIKGFDRYDIRDIQFIQKQYIEGNLKIYKEEQIDVLT